MRRAGWSPLSSLCRPGCFPHYIFLSPRLPPQPAARVPTTSAQALLLHMRSDAWVPLPRVPPCADVWVPGSSLRGERRARLMCDETEWSEPLGGSGRSGGGRRGEGGRCETRAGAGELQRGRLVMWVSVLKRITGQEETTRLGVSLMQRSET